MVVPLFQRPYVWSRETQWQPLWQDIVRLIEVLSNHSDTATHFLGAIVIQQVPGRLGALPAWNVIDGQQRLTTLQLLLDALHSELEGRGWQSLAGRVLPLIENPRDHRESEEDRYKLWPTNRDRQGFTAVMSAPTPVQYEALPASRLRDAHQFFAESIADWLGDDSDSEQRARMLVATVTERLEIASISLDANEDAQAIFETLNARGTPLSAADLIKNFIFQQVVGVDAEQAYLKYWADFETPWWEVEVTSGRVKNSRASLFLWQWLVARTLTDFPIREVFTQFKHYVNTVEKDVAALLPRIKAAADRYRALVEGAQRPLGPLTRDELFGYRVGVLDSEVARPLLIWLDEPEQASISHGDRERVLELLESWFVRRALVKAPSQGSNRLMVDLLREITRRPGEAVADVVEEYLRTNQTPVGYWPGDSEVREALTDAPVYWKYLRGRLRMVLEALEDEKRGYPQGKQLAMGPIVRGKATIEHLMPQGWRTRWGGTLGEERDVARDLAVQQLGNLTLVTQALNSRVSNGAWATKREHFLHSDDVLITKDALALAGDGEWTESTIAQRTSRMIEAILRIWPAPAGHIGVAATAPKSAPSTVDLAQLIAEGWLNAGTGLVPVSKSRNGTLAAIAQDGGVFVGDQRFDSLSAAASFVTKSNTNGWEFWAVAGSNKTMAELREEYLSSLGDADSNVLDED